MAENVGVSFASRRISGEILVRRLRRLDRGLGVRLVLLRFQYFFFKSYAAFLYGACRLFGPREM